MNTLNTEGTDRTFSLVLITQAEATWHLLKAAVAGKTPVLHAILLTSDTANTTVTIQYATESDGTGAAALTGAMTLADNGGFLIPFCADPRGCIDAGAAGRVLGFTSATGLVFGYAIVSV